MPGILIEGHDFGQFAWVAIAVYAVTMTDLDQELRNIVSPILDRH